MNNELTELTIVLTTCAMWPEVSVGDTELLNELVRRGHTVQVLPWNDAPIEKFVDADIVVLRSNWDFHHELDRFEQWLTDLEQAGANVQNRIPLVREHNKKSYLLNYADQGLPTPATLALESFDSAEVEEWMIAHNLETIVVKPLWGASGHRVERCQRAELTEVQQRWLSDPDARGAVVQQYVPEIAQGEHALVYFGGEFSHAFLRRPAEGDFRVHRHFGGDYTVVDDVDAALVELGRQTVAAMSTLPVYARIDVVGAGSQAMLMEVEINEPALGLEFAPGSGARFADALLSVHSLPK